eukprot:scaffold34595_cov160-Amphora_coffeaeformis.AAC.1
MSWMFTAVPPSPGNPFSKLNLDCHKRLTDSLKVQDLEIQKGRLRFCVTPETPPYIQWCTILSTVKSIRWVVTEVKGLTATDDEYAVADKLERYLAGISKESIMEIYEAFGNDIPKNRRSDKDESSAPIFKLAARRWDDSMVDKDKISTLTLSHELRRVVAQRYDWLPHYRNLHGSNTDLELYATLHGTCCMLELVMLVPAVRTDDLPRPGCKRVEAWMLVQSGEIQGGDVVLDPLCGKATYLVEGATTLTSQEGVRYIGVDQSMEQLEHARENIVETRTQNCIELHQGDTRHLDFLKDASVNVILTCPPFGIQFGRGSDLEKFYRECLKEWTRVLAAKGRLAVLIDVENADTMIQAAQDAGCLQLRVHREPFRLGRLQATVLVAIKLEEVDRDKLAVSATTTTQPATVLPWEGPTPLTRAGWSRLRAASLPSLSPYTQTRST